MAISAPSSDSKTNSEIPLPRPSGLTIKTATPKGRGVFTNHPIPSGTVIDICSVLVLDPSENIEHIEHTSLYHYTYNWPLTNTLPGAGGNDKAAKKTQAVVFGLGSMFNHSTEDQNVGFTRDLEKQVVVYKALRDIHPGEELCISYGDHLTFEDADKTASLTNGTGAHESEDEMLSRIQLET